MRGKKRRERKEKRRSFVHWFLFNPLPWIFEDALFRVFCDWCCHIPITVQGEIDMTCYAKAYMFKLEIWVFFIGRRNTGFCLFKLLLTSDTENIE